MDDASHRSYDPAYFAQMRVAEDQHFWFRYRNNVIAGFARQVWKDRPPGESRVLEIGCGTGNVLRVLEESCPGATLVGLELFPDGLRFARERTRAALVCGQIEHLPFSRPFAVIGLFDVLEHIPDDVAALGHVRDLLAPGGALMLTVPASPALWSPFDAASGHVRRYERRPLSALLTQAGFTVEYLSAFMMALYPAVWFHRRVAGGGEISPAEAIGRELRVVPGVNALMHALVSLERPWLSSRRRLPFGTSLLAIARKR